ncbi:MAG: GNAT family N-acetyltransferase [Candidatus Eremiobacteraeota bacterium]|nr:GNAT family N-acetyltransferase [Candidatus Eremiobacteraeota bacterium]
MLATLERLNVLSGTLCVLRPYRKGDEHAICAVADDFMVARWMTRAFPHPYTLGDAQRWLDLNTNVPLARHFAIEVDGTLTGGIGFDPYGGERDGAGSFGYWLGRKYWGRGIATEAARILSGYALKEGGLRRLEALVFAENAASVRVLEKADFSLEGVLRQHYLDRAGRVCDALLFARLS